MITFSFNGQQSSTYKVLLCDNNRLDKPKKKIELIEVPGRSDPLIISDNTKNNLDLSMKLFVEVASESQLASQISSIEKWLLVDDYKDLIFSDGIKFKAVATSGLTVELLTLNSAYLDISFSCKDY